MNNAVKKSAKCFSSIVPKGSLSFFRGSERTFYNDDDEIFFFNFPAIFFLF